MSIKQLNDQLRHNLPTTGSLGLLLITESVSHLPVGAQLALLRKIATFDDFNDDNDPHGESDFGKVTQDGQDYYWKIDYYDLDKKNGSEDPADPKVTSRVITVMETGDY